VGVNFAGPGPFIAGVLGSWYFASMLRMPKACNNCRPVALGHETAGRRSCKENGRRSRLAKTLVGDTGFAHRRLDLSKTIGVAINNIARPEVRFACKQCEHIHEVRSDAARAKESVVNRQTSHSDLPRNFLVLVEELNRGYSIRRVNLQMGRPSP